MNQRELALAERLQRSVTSAIRTCWLTPLTYKEFTFNISVQIRYDYLFEEIDEIDEAELYRVIDNASIGVLQYDLSALIMISDKLYGEIANHYTTHNVNIDVVNLTQPVLSTNYLNPPL
jgi:hypothetical protein